MADAKQMEFDQKRSEGFAENMLDVLNHGALNLMISIGHRTGLFDAMCEMDPATSHEIAAKANLDERYVREWLGSMVTGSIVEHNHDNGTYYLPREHAAWLTRKSTPNNLAIATQWIGLLGTVEDKIVDCFHNGGGVHYEHYERFNEVMASESHQTVVVPLVDELLPLVPGIKEKLDEGISVVDIGCGSGLAMVRLAEEFPNSTFKGYDFLEEAVETGRDLAREKGLTNITFEAKDAALIDDQKEYDLIFTFDAIHDQADPQKVLSIINSALKDDGVYFMQDIAGSSYVNNNLDHPLGTVIYTISCMHCMTVSLAQGGKGLGAMWGKELATEMLREAGFSEIEIKELPHDPINYYYIVTK